MFENEYTGINDSNGKEIHDGDTVIGYPNMTEFEICYSERMAAFVGRHTKKDKSTAEIPLFQLKEMYKPLIIKTENYKIKI